MQPFLNLPRSLANQTVPSSVRYASSEQKANSPATDPPKAVTGKSWVEVMTTTKTCNEPHPTLIQQQELSIFEQSTRPPRAKTPEKHPRAPAAKQRAHFGSLPKALHTPHIPPMTTRRSQLQEDTNYRVLRMLQDNPDLTQREIASQLGISSCNPKLRKPAPTRAHLSLHTQIARGTDMESDPLTEQNQLPHPHRLHCSPLARSYNRLRIWVCTQSPRRARGSGCSSGSQRDTEQSGSDPMNRNS